MSRTLIPANSPLTLRHVADAETRDLGGGKLVQIVVPERDPAAARAGDPDDRLQQRRLAGAVAAEERDDLPLVRDERGLAQDVALAVVRVHAVERQERGAFVGAIVAAGARREHRRARADVDFLHGAAAARVVGGAVDQHPAFVHHRHAVGEREHAIDVVLDQQHRNLLRNALDELAHAFALRRGESGQRLVEQQEPRRGREREAPCRAAAARRTTTRRPRRARCRSVPESE